MTECPKCKSQKIIAGRFSVNLRSTRVALSFVPGALKWYQFSAEGGADLRPEAFACADCGMVWTSVSYPENLRLLIQQLEKKQ